MSPEDKEKLEKALGYIEIIVLRAEEIDAVSLSCAQKAEKLLTEVLERDNGDDSKGI